ncbi:heme-binding protein [Sphingomonas sp. LB3N6]|uniref:GlcG/HbpS family heme-binding protein n=1 Tax=Sphingomonas fucosidasi TaxID=3096164 RepID=UPI002FC69206
MTLVLSLADAIVRGALAEAVRRGARPIAVVVVDGGGHIVAAARQDGASFLRIDIACGKAQGAIGMGNDTRVLAERAAANPVFFNSLSAATGGRIVLSAGGVLVPDDRPDAAPIGAIGISGDTSDVDEACAFAGLDAASNILRTPA